MYGYIGYRIWIWIVRCFFCGYIILTCKYTIQVQTHASRCIVNYTAHGAPVRSLVLESGHFFQRKSILLDVSERITHQLATELFHILLVDVLNYDAVKKTHSREINYFDPKAIIHRLANFDDIINKTNNGMIENNDVATINVEAWIPIQNFQYLQPNIRHLGLISTYARFGWFVRFSTVKEQFIPYTLFTNDKYVMKFDLFTSGDENKFSKYITMNNVSTKTTFLPPQCCNSSCAVVLSSSKGDVEPLIADISKYGLLMQVIWLGDKLHKIVSQLIREKKEFIVLHWAPSEVIQKFDDYTLISFPPCQPYSSHCNYDPYSMQKLASQVLERSAEAAFTTLRNFHLEKTQVEELLSMYENVSNNYNVTKIACDWIGRNSESITRWVTSPVNETLYIAMLFATGETAIGAKMAIDYINNYTKLLPNYELKILLFKESCNGEADYHFIDFAIQYPKLVGILGPTCENAVESVAGISAYYKIPIISSLPGKASTPHNQKTYHSFFRNSGESMKFTEVYLQLFHRFNWTIVATLVQDGYLYSEYLSALQTAVNGSGSSSINVVYHKFPRDSTGDAIELSLHKLKDENFRIIIVEGSKSIVKDIMCKAVNLKMTPEEGYVWFLPPSLEEYDTLVPHEDKTCNPTNIQRASNLHLSVSHRQLGPPDSIMQENITVDSWWTKRYKKELKLTREKNQNISESKDAGFAYDSIWMLAIALNKLISLNPLYLANIHERNIFKQYIDFLQSSNFDGVSGNVKFTNGSFRELDVVVYQWVNNSRYEEVACLRAPTNDSKPLLTYSGSVLWATASGETPSDGKSTCILPFLEITVQMDCNKTKSVVTIIFFVLISFILLLGFLTMRARYKQKVRLARKFMDAIGVDVITETMLADLDNWEIPKKHVVINRKLGEGEFGIIYGGEAYFNSKGWLPVAVKTLKLGTTTEKKLAFLSEAEIMKRLQHKNVVKILGVCNREEPLYNIMEFMLYGDLKNYLLSRRYLVKEGNVEETEVSSSKLTTMALDVAQAIEYINELNYVHRDIASRNCMVDANRVIKLGDFGMARTVVGDNYYRFNRQGILPVRWMAPESLSAGIFTGASDIWSYGILIYEIITFGNYPYKELSNHQVLEYVRSGKTLNIPSNVKPLLKELLLLCWNKNPAKRPRALEIIEILIHSPNLLTPSLEHPINPLQKEQADRYTCKRYSCTSKKMLNVGFNDNEKGKGNWTTFKRLNIDSHELNPLMRVDN